MSQIPDDSPSDWFDRSGHLSELALSFVSDGQEAELPSSVLSHLSECAHCQQRLAQMASYSLALGAALEATPKSELSLEPHAAPRFPWFGLGVAACLALLGKVPLLISLEGISASWFSFFEFSKTILRGFRLWQLSSSSELRVYVTATWMLSACLLCGIAFLLKTQLLLSNAKGRMQ